MVRRVLMSRNRHHHNNHHQHHLRSHFGSSRDRLPGFRLGSFTSVGSSGATLFPNAFAQVLVDIGMCYSMLMNRGSSLALFLVLFGSAPSQVRAAGIGQGENNPENEFDTGNRLVDSCVPVPFGAVPCVSCSSPGARKPCLGKGGLVRVFVTSLLSHGAAPSLHSWRHTVDLATIVKFDQKAFLSKKGLAAAMLAAPLAALRLGLPACSRICPPCSQSSWSLLHRLAACRAATLWILCDTCSTVSSDAGFNIWPVTFWILCDTSTVSGDAGKGTNKGEKKAGNLVLSHVPWLTWLPVQVSSLRLAAASEAALIGILKPYWIAAATGSRVSLGLRPCSRLRGGSCDVRDPHIRRHLLLPRFLLVFDRGK